MIAFLKIQKIEDFSPYVNMLMGRCPEYARDIDLAIGEYRAEQRLAYEAEARTRSISSTQSRTTQMAQAIPIEQDFVPSGSSGQASTRAAIPGAEDAKSDAGMEGTWPKKVQWTIGGLFIASGFVTILLSYWMRRNRHAK